MGTSDWIAILAAAGTIIMTPALAWWGSYKYFSGVFHQWKKSSEEWRAQTDFKLAALNLPARATLDENVRLRLDNVEKDIQDLDALNTPDRVALQEVMRNKLDAIERDVHRLREWRHHRADPYIGAMDALEARVRNLEARIKP